MRDHDLSRARHHQTCIKGSILTRTASPARTLGPEHSPVHERVSQTTGDSFRLTSNVYRQSGSDLAGEDHCDPRQIRLGSLSSPDESDQLPRQDREEIRRRCHDAQLEYNRESRENPETGLTGFQRTLTEVNEVSEVSE